MPRRDGAPRLVGQRTIEAQRDVRSIGFGRQFFRFGDAEHRLAFDIRTQYQRARLGHDVRRKPARQHGFAGAG